VTTAPDLTFDRFLPYAELTDAVHGIAAAHPDIVEVASIGRSYEDRDIWLATVTNRATGPHTDKPALWVDANIHATELTGSVAALHLLHALAARYGADELVTRLLDTRTVYVVPRLNPDGAELAMATPPRYVRSSVRNYPRVDQQDGLVPSDIDGDGRILTMRVPDHNGTWKVSDQDARLLVPRDPAETGPGPYYRLLTEGRIQNYDGATVTMAPPLAGLDLNRNYPVDWRPEGEQTGAGPYPTSEPEIRAVVGAIVDRPNICAFIQYHTMSGVHLRPSSVKADDALPTFDLRVYKRIGRQATEFTGYPAVSVFHDFKYDPKDVITGVADDWAYEHLGVFAWTTEFWSPQRAAGITDYKFIEWGLDHPVEDDLKLLAWSDSDLAGRGFVDWYPFDHEQLGPVEIGGWDTAYCWRNPPPHMLAKEVAPHTDFAIWHALISPRLEVRATECEALGGDTWRVRIVVENTGWLPTNVTARALERKTVRPVEIEIAVAAGAGDAARVVGNPRVEAGQLGGRALKVAMLQSNDPTTDRAKAEWIVHAPPGTTVELVARHQRAGVARALVTLAAN